MKLLVCCAGAALLLSVSLSLVLSPTSHAADNPQAWLERMSSAMSLMSYQGTFIYIADERMETMRITHVVDEQGSRERLVSVSGPHREVIRDESGLKWISAEADSVMADPVVSWPMFLQQSVRGLPGTSAHYQFKLGDQKRIAERTAQRLDIIPADQYRYGYSLWLESGSGLLLQWQLNDQEGAELAKLVFTELKMGSEVDLNELKKSASTKMQQVASGLPVGAAKAVSESAPWQAQWLPPGFHMTANRAPGQSPENSFQHQVYSDGIASVSLYVEPLQSSSGLGLGMHQLGTSHVFSRKVGDALVTVVGDVPASTVEKIAQSVNHN